MERLKKESFRGNLRFIFMGGLASSSAMIGLLPLISCGSLPSSRHDLSIKVFTSTGDQFWVNSVIIEGSHEVMLVDAQLTKTNAERVLTEIIDTKKPLTI